MSAGRAQDNPSVEPPPVKAPLFRSVIERMDPERRLIVLDLGRASKASLELFSRYRCRLDVCAIEGAAIDTLNAEQDAEAAAAFAATLLPVPRDEATDLVLCWDLLNYLEKRAIAALMHQVALRARAGAVAHALIEYSARTMPARPRRLVPTDELLIADLSADGERIAAPRYTPEDLALALPDYKIDRGMLLTNGMQEFLFKR